MKAVLAFPGDLGTPTGGYAYDRAVLAALAARGWQVAPLSLPARFPFPGPEDVQEAMARLAAVPADTVLLIDGLALGALPADALSRLRSPMVGLVHHPLALEAGLSEGQQDHLKASERAALATCAEVVATSPATGRRLVADYGVAAERLTIAEPGVEDAPRAPADGDPPRILAIGSVIPRKNYGALVNALARVRDVPWQATIVGSLEMAPATVRDVRETIAARGLDQRIVLAGARPPELLSAAYDACDLFVHPALFEGYGMVLAEALRRGLPMIASTGGAAAETVPDGAAVKIPPGDEDALTAALDMLLRDPAARRRLADAAFEAGARLPGWDHTAAHVEAALARAGLSAD